MGGFIPDPGTEQSQGVLPTLTARLNELGRTLGVTIFGISGYRSPAHSVAVGGFANDPHTQGIAEDIGVNSQTRISAAIIPEATLGRFGLYRPFDPSNNPSNPEVNHIQLLPGTGKRPSPVRSNQPTGTPTASQSLAQLWIQNGGAPGLANIMAAIGMAESGGRVDATNKNSNGTIDRGVWQINSSHTQFDAQRLLSDPNYNAKAAVSIEKSQGLGAWTTYTSGAYHQFLAGAASATTSGFGGTRPGGGTPGSSSGSADASTFFDSYDALGDQPRTAPANSAQQVSLTNQDVSFWSTVGAPFKWYWGQAENTWKEFTGIINGPGQIIHDATGFMDFTTKFLLNPFQWLRGVEFITGLIIMALGITMLKPTGGRANRDIHRVTAGVVGATPIGREIRMATGRRAGHREGQTEYARNQARRASKAREAERS